VHDVSEPEFILNVPIGHNAHVLAVEFKYEPAEQTVLGNDDGDDDGEDVGADVGLGVGVDEV
jgi:hypothetical protein